LFYEGEPPKVEACFDKPFCALFNTAVGGNRGGAKGIGDGIFPSKYCIGYVRYSKRDSAGSVETSRR